MFKDFKIETFKKATKKMPYNENLWEQISFLSNSKRSGIKKSFLPVY